MTIVSPPDDGVGWREKVHSGTLGVVVPRLDWRPLLDGPPPPMNASNDLLKELRIDRSAPPRPRARRRWPLFAALGAVALGAAVAFGLLREPPLPVRTAVAVAEVAGSTPAAASVLDASGYV